MTFPPRLYRAPWFDLPVILAPEAIAVAPLWVDDAPLPSRPTSGSLHTMLTQRFSVWSAPLWGPRRLLGYVTAPLRDTWIVGQRLPRGCAAAALRAGLLLWDDADTVETE